MGVDFQIDLAVAQYDGRSVDFGAKRDIGGADAVDAAARRDGLLAARMEIRRPAADGHLVRGSLHFGDVFSTQRLDESKEAPSCYAARR